MNLNLKNLDYKHVLFITITLLLAMYATLVADGVPLPAKLAAIAAALTSIANWLNGSPVATQAQVMAKMTLSDRRERIADLRARVKSVQPNQEDKTR